jgi:hypothetical protein
MAAIEAKSAGRRDEWKDKRPHKPGGSRKRTPIYFDIRQNIEGHGQKREASGFQAHQQWPKPERRCHANPRPPYVHSKARAEQHYDRRARNVYGKSRHSLGGNPQCSQQNHAWNNEQQRY